MSEEKNEVQKVVTQLPFMPGSNQVVKATERIEMQRATAQVLASFEFAIRRPRDEENCYDRIMQLCDNIAFASDALYRKPVGGGQIAEGVGIKATKAIMRIWGNIDAGYIEHGSYDTESQVEAYCYDLESNTRFCERYTVKHERLANQEIKPVKDPAQIAVLVKARSSIEVRNCIQSVIPDFIWEEVKTKCKRVSYSTVPNVQEAWKGHVERWARVGVNETSLFRYVNRKPNEKDKLNPADIVDLRLLWTACADDPSTLDVAFPERDKKAGNLGEGQKSEGKPPMTQKPAQTAQGAGAAKTATTSGKPSEQSAVSGAAKTEAAGQSQSKSAAAQAAQGQEKSASPKSAPAPASAAVTPDAEDSATASASATSSPDPAQDGDDPKIGESNSVDSSAANTQDSVDADETSFGDVSAPSEDEDAF